MSSGVYRPPGGPTQWSGGARFVAVGHNRKLAPVDLVPTDKRPRLTPRGPFVSLTDVSIAATCSTHCPFHAGGCYVTSGGTKLRAAALDESASGRTGEQVIADEVRLIDESFKGGRVPQDGARGGRDLRLHVGGDVASEEGARLLAGASSRWRGRGGGTVWSFTHWWRDVPREAFGEISVLASIERAEDIALARAAGYPAAIVVDEFRSPKAYTLDGSDSKIVPCPAETRGATCVTCRLCLDADLLAMGVTIAFQVHGPTASRASSALVQLRTPNRLSPHPQHRRGIPMHTQSIVIRLVGSDINSEDPLVRVIPLHLQAGGTRVARMITRRGARHDKGAYVAIELELETSDEPAFKVGIEGLPKYLKSRAKERGLDALRVELETLELAAEAS